MPRLTWTRRQRIPIAVALLLSSLLLSTAPARAGTKRAIVLVDRTGSMLTIRANGNSRCEDAAAMAENDVREFFASHPDGSLAVWAFNSSFIGSLTNGFVGHSQALDAVAALPGCVGSTPLADAICEAVDTLLAEFPGASPGDLLLYVSSDGGENFITGPCFGLWSTTEPPPPGNYDVGSWQYNVWNKIIGSAVVNVRFWGAVQGPPGPMAGLDPETGLEQAQDFVSDAGFFDDISTSSGGDFLSIDDTDPLPSAAHSTVPCLSLCPFGDIGFDVVVRDDAGTPIPSIKVVVSFAACDSVLLCEPGGGESYAFEPGRFTISTTTDVAGLAHFQIRGGGGSADTLAEIRAGGVTGILLGRRAVASPDQDGDMSVGPNDLVLFQGKMGTGDRSADFNCDNLVNATDLTVFAAHFNNPGHMGYACVAGEYTLEVLTVGDGAVNVDPDLASYGHGTKVMLDADPDPGRGFVGWSGDTTAQVNPMFLVMDGDRVVTATFAPIYTLDVTVVGNGSVTKDPDRSDYLEGTPVTLRAIPGADGWHFEGWTGDTTAFINPLDLVITRDRSLTATFALNQYELTVGVAGSGSVATDPDQTVYDHGTSVTLTPSPSPGWRFVTWSGDASGSDDPLVVVMDGPKSITASFCDAAAHALFVSTEGLGTVVRSPDQLCHGHGSIVTLTAVPDPGSSFQGWSGDATGLQNPLPLVMDGDKYVTATFRAPDPAYSDVPHFVLDPVGDFDTDIVVRDEGGAPVAGVQVDILFGACDTVRFCRLEGGEPYEFGQGSWVVTGVTDAFGTLSLPLRGGGVSHDSLAEVWSKGVLLARRPVASTDQDGDLMVTQSDVDAILYAWGVGVYDPTADLNRDGDVTASDIFLCDTQRQKGASCESALDAPPSSQPPRTVRLHAGVPNPTTEGATVRFDLPVAAKVGLTIHDLAGRSVRAAFIEKGFPAGRHEWTWDGRNDAGERVGAGVYFIRLRAAGFSTATRMVVLR